MQRIVVYQHQGAPGGFIDLRILWDGEASLVTLHYETRRDAAYGYVLRVDEAIDFVERLQRVIGHPWTSRPAYRAIEALVQLKARMGSGRPSRRASPAA